MNKIKNNSTKVSHKDKLRELRLKKLEKRLKSNILKRKKSISRKTNG